ncbi:MAG: hypothetical protein Q8M03_08320, partial [Legionella sp.]|nr:hypothetical protein [Legionella sp.]
GKTAWRFAEETTGQQDEEKQHGGFSAQRTWPGFDFVGSWWVVVGRLVLVQLLQLQHQHWQ